MTAGRSRAEERRVREPPRRHAHAVVRDRRLDGYLIVTGTPVIEVVGRFPVTGLNRVKSALASALLPFLKANPPKAFTCKVTVSDTPVHGTPGKSLKKNPLPCASLWPLTWVTLTSPNATFNDRAHVKV